MLPHIHKLFAPPVFEDDEDKTRTARVLNTLLVIMMLFLILFGGIAVPFVLEEKLYDLVIVLVLFLTLAVARWQMRRGRVRFASALWVSTSWVVCTVFLLFAGGMTSIAAVFYVATTIIAGLLLGTRVALINALACILAGLVMVITESSGHPLPRLFSMPAIVGWVNMTLTLLLTTVVLNLVLRGFNDALALARRQVEERKQAEDGQRKALAEALQATHALRESEARLRILFDSAQDNILIHSIDADGMPGKYTEVNQSTCDTLGYSRQELLTMGPQDTTVVNDPALLANISQSILQDGHARFEAVGQTKDGREIPFEIRTHLLSLGDQQLVMAVSRDITERVRTEEVRRQAEEALRESEEKLRSILISMDDLVFALDNDGVFCDYYQPLDRPDLHSSPEAFLGKSFKEVMPPHVVESIDVAINAVATSGTVQQVDYYLEIPEGIKWYSARISARKDASGEFAGVTVVARDITERKRAENSARIQRELAQALNAATRLDEGLRLCVEAAVRASGMDCGGVYLVEETFGALDLVFHKLGFGHFSVHHYTQAANQTGNRNMSWVYYDIP